MWSKRVIATLIAGSFAAAQAGAHSYLSDATGSISDRGYEAQAGEPTPSEDSSPHYVTVYNPDGTSYSLVADADTVTLEPEVLAITAESMPEHLTVFDPDGTVTAYHFTPTDVALIEPMLDEDGYDAIGWLAVNGDAPIVLVEVAEPMIVGLAADDSPYGSMIVFDAEGAPWSVPAYWAASSGTLERVG